MKVEYAYLVRQFGNAEQIPYAVREPSLLPEYTIQGAVPDLVATLNAGKFPT